MSYTDPSGHFFTLLAAAVSTFAKLNAIQAFAINFVASTAQALVRGASFGDALKGGLISGASAAAFVGLGNAFSGAEGFWSNAYAQQAAFGVTGGLTNLLQGGKFGHGFASASLSAPLSGGAGNALGRVVGRDAGRIIASSIVGGSISAATGGKFSNGAAYAGFTSVTQRITDTSDGYSEHRGEVVQDQDTSQTGPGRKTSSTELAAALEEAFDAVDDALFGGRTFETQEDAAWFLHDRLYKLSVDYGIEFGARIYRSGIGEPWRITAPKSQGFSNQVWSGDVPASANGGIAGNWHSHPSGNPPNTIDFGNAFLAGRRPHRSFVSHMNNGKAVLSSAGVGSRRFEMVER